jgi:hypothetical protein
LGNHIGIYVLVDVGQAIAEGRWLHHAPVLPLVIVDDVESIALENAQRME